MRETHLVRLALLLCLLLSGPGQAASRTIKPGQVLGVSEDIVLSGDDVLEVRGTAHSPAASTATASRSARAVTGRAGSRSRTANSADWEAPAMPALDVTAGGDGDQIVIEHRDFHACGAIHLSQRGNLGHGLPPQHPARQLDGAGDEPAERIAARASAPPGESPARKFFQGNRVAKSVVLFENTGNWLIGGDEDDGQQRPHRHARVAEHPSLRPTWRCAATTSTRRSPASAGARCTRSPSARRARSWWSSTTSCATASGWSAAWRASSATTWCSTPTGTTSSSARRPARTSITTSSPATARWTPT